jgi:hypothetical protein
VKGKTAGYLFLAICAVLAGLLFTSAITPLAGGIVFAAALAVLGILSRGFGRK